MLNEYRSKSLLYRTRKIQDQLRNHNLSFDLFFDDLRWDGMMKKPLFRIRDILTRISLDYGYGSCSF
jgi:hypothetical protein